MKILKKYKDLLLIFLTSFLLFYRSLFVFFTNDDFFHFITSRAYTFKDFLNFFNLVAPVTGFPNYRPFATQVIYFLDWKFFNLNPLPMHIFLFALFFGTIYLVYKISQYLISGHQSPTTNHASLIAAFLYSVSATHFGQLYFVATQEIIYGFFFLLTVWLFIKYLGEGKLRFLAYSFLTFLLTLASKEPAVTLPFVLGLVYLFFKWQGKTKVGTREITLILSPFLIILAGYLYMRFFHYGFAKGDSYLWAFEPKRILNSLAWYGLWSLNIPEMLVDFVGPGLKFLPSLFKHYSKEIIPIFVLFSMQLALLIYGAIKGFLFKSKKSAITHYPLTIAVFSTAWFTGTLVPVLFLPIHKFSFYLTVPLFGVVLFISYLLINLKSKIINLLFITVWVSLSVLTLNLTGKVSWITRGEETAGRAYQYFSENEAEFSGKRIILVDTPKDTELPWSPTETVKVVLSNQDFFTVFFPDKFEVKYDIEGKGEGIKVESRQFLGY